MTTVVGLDLSLTSTGVARITTDPVPNPIAVGRVSSTAQKEPTTASRAARLRRLTTGVLSNCQGADLVCVEGPSYASSGAGTWDRAGYWWMVVNSLTAAGMSVVEIPPSNLKMYALGKGGGSGAGKDDVLSAVVRRYPHVTFSGNDEADALILAAMGARFAGFPIEPSMPQTHLRGMTNVRWAP